MDKDLIKRVLHGSDFPVPPYGIFPFLMGYMKLDDYLYARSERNPLERDFQIKKAVGFPEETFNRVFDLFPWRAQRQLTRDD